MAPPSEVPTDLKELARWGATAVLIAVLGYVTKRVVRRIDELTTITATFPGRLAAMLLGWRLPEEEELRPDETNPLTLRRVLDDELPDRWLHARPSFAVRIAVMCIGIWRVTGALASGQPIITATTVIALLIGIMLEPLSLEFDQRRPFDTKDKAPRAWLAGSFMILWGLYSLTRHDGYVNVMWVGVVELGLCLLATAWFRGCGHDVRRWAAPGWAMVMIGDLFAFAIGPSMLTYAAAGAATISVIFVINCTVRQPA